MDISIDQAVSPKTPSRIVKNTKPYRQKHQAVSSKTPSRIMGNFTFRQFLLNVLHIHVKQLFVLMLNIFLHVNLVV